MLILLGLIGVLAISAPPNILAIHDAPALNGANVQAPGVVNNPQMPSMSHAHLFNGQADNLNNIPTHKSSNKKGFSNISSPGKTIFVIITLFSSALSGAAGSLNNQQPAGQTSNLQNRANSFQQPAFGLYTENQNKFDSQQNVPHNSKPVSKKCRNRRLGCRGEHQQIKPLNNTNCKKLVDMMECQLAVKESDLDPTAKNIIVSTINGDKDHLLKVGEIGNICENNPFDEDKTNGSWKKSYASLWNMGEKCIQHIKTIVAEKIGVASHQVETLKEAASHNTEELDGFVDAFDHFEYENFNGEAHSKKEADQNNHNSEHSIVVNEYDNIKPKLGLGRLGRKIFSVPEHEANNLNEPETFHDAKYALEKIEAKENKNKDLNKTNIDTNLKENRQKPRRSLSLTIADLYKKNMDKFTKEKVERIKGQIQKQNKSNVSEIEDNAFNDYDNYVDKMIYETYKNIRDSAAKRIQEERDSQNSFIPGLNEKKDFKNEKEVKFIGRKLLEVESDFDVLNEGVENNNKLQEENGFEVLNEGDDKKEKKGFTVADLYMTNKFLNGQHHPQDSKKDQQNEVKENNQLPKNLNGLKGTGIENVFKQLKTLEDHKHPSLVTENAADLNPTTLKRSTTTKDDTEGKNDKNMPDYSTGPKYEELRPVEEDLDDEDSTDPKDLVKPQGIPIRKDNDPLNYENLKPKVEDIDEDVK